MLRSRSHPITISSPPIEPDGSPAKAFEMHIKSFGPGTWSEALLAKARKGESVDEWKVWVGGPNGKLSINPYDCDKIVLCGGGIGCTPFLALAADLHHRGLLKEAKLPPKVQYVHVERELSTFESTYAAHLEMFKASAVVSPALYCTSIGKGEMVEGGGASACGIRVTGGRPDFVEILKQAPMDEGTKIVTKTGAGAMVIGVYACGPRAMMASVRQAVQAASVDGVKFYLHEETYEL